MILKKPLGQTFEPVIRHRSAIDFELTIGSPQSESKWDTTKNDFNDDNVAMERHSKIRMRTKLLYNITTLLPSIKQQSSTDIQMADNHSKRKADDFQEFSAEPRNNCKPDLTIDNQGRGFQNKYNSSLRFLGLGKRIQ